MRARYICHTTPRGFIKRCYLVVLIFFKRKKKIFTEHSAERRQLSYRDTTKYYMKNLDVDVKRKIN